MSNRRTSLAVADQYDAEKRAVAGDEPSSFGAHLRGNQFASGDVDVGMVVADENKLHRNLKGRHMQMIAM